MGLTRIRLQSVGLKSAVYCQYYTLIKIDINLTGEQLSSFSFDDAMAFIGSDELVLA